MFVLNTSEERRDTFIRTITIRKPDSSERGYKEHSLRLEFREMTQQEINEIYYQDAPDPMNPSDAVLLERCVVGWKDVNGADGEPLPFSPENLRALVGIPYIRGEAARTYIESMSGTQKDRKRKN